MRTTSLAAAGLLILGTGAAYAQQCVGLASRLDRDNSRSLVDATTILNSRSVKSSEELCGSLANIFAKIANHKRPGGRKLEEDKPLDQAAAQANLDEALKDDAIRARLEEAREDVTDENARLILEAAILDSEGYYNARELIVAQLIQRMK